VKTAVLMKCGHTAQAEDQRGTPVCAICLGLDPRAVIPEDEQPDLNNRAAVCSCGKRMPSRIDLPFFEHKRYAGEDRFYCGHAGRN
jgi:hypothetical protein